MSCLKTGADAPVTAVRVDQQQLPKTITYTSGSGTYTPTPGTVYIDVEVVGAGSGGAGSGTASQGSGGAGGSTTFGTSLITSSGGGAVSGGGGGGGAGGAGTVNSPAFTIEPTVSVTGQGNSLANPSSVGLAGGIGGDLGYGSGRSGYYNSSGATGPALSGGGGQGGGSGFTAGSITGAGGGSGAKVKARILYPSGNYTYSVGRSEERRVGKEC